MGDKGDMGDIGPTVRGRKGPEGFKASYYINVIKFPNIHVPYSSVTLCLFYLRRFIFE